MSLEALEAQGWRAGGEGYWVRKTLAQAWINLKKQQLWVKEIRAVQDIPSAAEWLRPLSMLRAVMGSTLKGIPDYSCTWLTAKQVFSYETWTVLEFSLRHAESFRHAHSVSHAPNTANRKTCPTMSKSSP